MDKLLACWDKEKKYKHSKHCHYQRKHFSLFLLSVDGMLGKEALVVLTNLSRLISTKLKEPLSQVRGWFNGLITITATRSYSKMILRDCLTSSLWDQELD